MIDRLRIEPISDVADFEQCEAVQRQVWTMSETEIVPVHLLRASVHKGGLILAAWDNQEMVGFVFGFLGRRADGRLVHHSHMAAVIPAYQGKGVGLALKIAQAKEVAAQGIDLITWTFDPLEARNGHFNLNLLGGIVRTYLVNFYGAMKDGLNLGLASDRFEVELWPGTERVRTRLAQSPPDELARPAAQILAADWQDDLPRPPEVLLPLPAAPFLVEIPARFQTIKRHDLELAKAWRLYFRQMCQAAFPASFAVTALHRIPESVENSDPQRVFYLFEPVPPDATG
ncbi:MAG: GNAT family N-acetyltransferase [Caldilineales bacterium]|nr:GNAT family N-acetyltransferase [Caldilineales bacterium]